MGRRNVLPLVLLLAVACVCWAQQQGPQPINPGRSTLLVRVFKSGLFSVFAHDHEIRAPILSGTIDASGAGSVELKVDAREMQVLDPKLDAEKRAEVQETMHSDQVLDTRQFPEITFVSRKIQSTGQGKYQVSGELSLHGVAQSLVVPVQYVEGRYTGKASIRQTNFGIKPIRLAGGTVSVKDVVEIEFDIVPARP